MMSRCRCLSPYAHNFIMRTGTPHMRIFLVPARSHMGTPRMQYAYGDQFLTCCDLSLSHALNQNFHMRCTMNQNFVNAHMHTPCPKHEIPVCIRGSRSIPVCIQGSSESPYAYGDCISCDPRMHTGIKINPRMHMEILVCIWGSHDT
jgi:hypothetical protein